MNCPEHLKHTSGEMVNRKPVIPARKRFPKAKYQATARKAGGVKMARNFVKRLEKDGL